MSPQVACNVIVFSEVWYANPIALAALGQNWCRRQCRRSPGACAEASAPGESSSMAFDLDGALPAKPELVECNGGPGDVSPIRVFRRRAWKNPCPINPTTGPSGCAQCVRLFTCHERFDEEEERREVT